MINKDPSSKEVREMKNIEIPQEYQEFAKEVAQLCVKYSLRNFTADFSPSVNDNKWNERLRLNWSTGRHGVDITKIHLSADVSVRLEIEASVRDFYKSLIP